MKLSATDLEYINQRLDEYELKYQEVYDELKDHILLAIETARANGDERDIEFLYNDMMDTQFPGYYVFEKIAGAYEKAYRAKIKKVVWANFKRSLFNPLNVSVIVMSLFFGYQMGETKRYNDILTALLFLVSVLPVGYVYYKTRVIKTGDGKKSIVKDYVKKQAQLLILNYNTFYSIMYFLRKWHLSFIPLSPCDSIQVLIISLSVIYGFSVIQLCNQEIKLPMIATKKQ